MVASRRTGVKLSDQTSRLTTALILLATSIHEYARSLAVRVSWSRMRADWLASPPGSRRTEHALFRLPVGCAVHLVRQSLRRWLNTALQEHDEGLMGLKTDYSFDPIRSDPRFAELLRKVVCRSNEAFRAFSLSQAKSFALQRNSYPQNYPQRTVLVVPFSDLAAPARM
jgi:hypothetical protein